MIIRLVLFWDAYFAPVFFFNLLILFSFIHSFALTILLKFYLDARIIYCPVVPPLLDLLSEALFASPFRPPNLLGIRYWSNGFAAYSFANR